MKQSKLALIGALVLSGVFCASPTWAAFGRTNGSAAVSDSGQANYSIPLFTPPGTNGMTPSLALNYSSGAGEGAFGFGWSLSGLSGISRCARTWAQDSTQGIDRLCLDGNRLRVQTGTYNQAGSTYRTELETYSRITAYGTAGTGPAYFIVELKNGLIYEYGNTEDSRIQSVGQVNVRFWAVNKIRDRDGNAILFNYFEDTTNGSFRISNIQYTQNTAMGVSPPYTVSFAYNSLPAGEVDADYFASSLIKRIVRATSIDVTRGSTLIRRYVLSYEANLSSAMKSRLQSVQECAGVGGTDCLAATTFAYQNGTPGLATEANTGVPVGAGTMFLDVNGDGRTDLVYSSNGTSGSGTWMVAFANSSGGYNTPVNTGITNTNFTQAIPIDYNADGLDDFLVPYSGGTWWAVLGTTSGLATPVNTSITATGAGGNARAMDINGDGLDDLVFAIVTGSSQSVQGRLRVAGGTFAAATYLYGPVSNPYSIVGPVFGTSQFTSRRRNPDFNGDGLADFIVHSKENDAGIFIHTWEVIRSGGLGAVYIGNFDTTGGPYWGDLNGDGCTDVVYTRSGAWRYRFSNCVGLTPEFSGPTLGGMLSTEAAVMDWDGDGFDDIVGRDYNTLRFNFIRSNGESLLPQADSGVSTSEVGYLFVGDTNGDGLTDVVSRSPSGTWLQNTHAGLHPDLLLTATDGFGQFTTFSYTTLPQANYTKGSGNSLGGFPYIDWQGAMPIVASSLASDGNGGSFTTNYWYYGAVAHLQGRGMAGFWKVRRTDTRNGIIQNKYFEQIFPKTGVLTQQEVFQPDGATTMSRLTASSTAVTLDNTANNQRYVVYPASTSAQQYGVSTNLTYNGVLVRSEATTNLFDNATGTIFDSTVTVSEPASGANGVSDGKTWTAHTELPTASLTNDPFNWCIGRPGEVRVTKQSTLTFGAAITRTTTSTWDTVKCRPTATTAEPGSGTLQVTTGIQYDSFGNVNQTTVTGVGMTARTTNSLYSDATHPTGQFPLTVTNALSQTAQTDWDYDLGVIKKYIDPNGAQVEWIYDAFGRRTRENRADGTYVTWALSTCPSCDPRVKTFIDQQSFSADASPLRFDRRQMYLDQFDRLIYDYALRPDTYYTVSTRTFDSLGRVTREYFPYSSAGSAVGYTTFSYDLTNRPIQISRPKTDSDPAPQSSTVAYEGLTTRTADFQGKNSFTISNSLGQLVRTGDNSGFYEEFEYDAFGSTKRIQDSAGNLLQASTYNTRGMLTAITDMDLGSWGFSPNALGEVTAQTDAKALTTNYWYDLLGRRTNSSNLVDGANTWTWGNSGASHNIGSLASVSGTGYSESYSFDSIGRPSTTTISADTSYQIDFSYNAIGKLKTLTYPTSTSSYRLKLQYEYQNAILSRIRECADASCLTFGTSYWTANSFNGRGQLTQETLGNGLASTRVYDSVTGWLKTIQTGSGGGAGVQNLSYEWDLVGNLTKRKDLNQGALKEEFFYDDLYRLDYSQLNGTQNHNLSYDALGNITSNDLIPPGTSTQIGTYTYHATKKHQVISTQNGWSFGYDSNGNMTSGRGATITWTGFNAPASIVNGADSSTFSYTPDRQYWKQVSNFTSGGAATTIYVGGLLEKVTTSTGTDYRHMIRAGNSTIIVSRQSTGTNSVNYVTTDHLGNGSAVTNASGAILVNSSFGAFGQRRGSNWSGYPSSADWLAIAATTRRGYTDHSMLDNLFLIHMNGRVQDPLLGRFLSADPFVFNPLSTQGYNRYSYVENRPLSLIDPSGFRQEGSTNYIPYDTTYTYYWENSHALLDGWLNSGKCADPQSPWDHQYDNSGAGYSRPTAFGPRRPTAPVPALPRPAAVSCDQMPCGSSPSPVTIDVTAADVWQSIGAEFVNTIAGAANSIVNILINNGEIEDDDAVLVGPWRPFEPRSSLFGREGAVIATGLLAVAPIKGIGRGSGAARGATATARGVSVLGHASDGYVSVAKTIGARYFNVPTKVWDAMSPAQQWAANAKFLDRLIARGDTVVLATEASAARAGSFFARELEYLSGRGYTLAEDGMRMLPPGP
jgi:RHS repeat-associated protein